MRLKESKKVDKTMDAEKETLFLDALLGIESELKKLNALLEPSLLKDQRDVSVFHGILTALKTINIAIRTRSATLS